MASKATGYQLASLVSDEREFDPQLGHLQVQVWEGTKAAILVKEAELEAAQWKLTRRKRNGNSPVYSIEASKPLDTPTDRWKIVTEMVQLDIRQNPKVIAAAVSADTLALWVQAIEAALAAGLSLPDYYTQVRGLTGTDAPIISDEEQELYNLMAMGVTSYEVHRPVLTRSRIIAPDYPEPFLVEAVTAIYTTTGLIACFNPPQEIISRLPADLPSYLTPLDCVWGWKLRQQESDFLLSVNRVEEQHSWVFAAWPLLLYDVIDASVPPGFIPPFLLPP